jgi:hypothetical protein
MYSEFMLSLSWSAQLSGDVPVDDGSLCGRAVVLGAAIEERLCIRRWTFPCRLNADFWCCVRSSVKLKMARKTAINAKILNVPLHVLQGNAVIFLHSNADLQSLTPDCSAVVRIRRKHWVCVIGATSEYSDWRFGNAPCLNRKRSLLGEV